MKRRFSVVLTLIVVMLFTSLKCFAKTDNNLTVSSEKAATKDIVEIATGDERFKTLVTALSAADLVETLKGEGPFTVFAPVNTAFEKIPKNDLDNLLKPENKTKLEGLLTYHVVTGKLTSQDLVKLNGKQIATVNGDKINVEVKDNEVYINGSKVIVKDVEAKNGVIHAIDTVLIPKEK